MREPIILQIINEFHLDQTVYYPKLNRFSNMLSTELSGEEVYEILYQLVLEFIF